MKLILIAAVLAMSPTDVSNALKDLNIAKKVDYTLHGENCWVTFSPNGLVKIEYTDGTYQLENILHMAQRDSTGEPSGDSWTIGEDIEIIYNKSQKILSFYNTYERLQDDDGRLPTETRRDQWIFQQLNTQNLKVSYSRRSSLEYRDDDNPEGGPQEFLSCTVKY